MNNAAREPGLTEQQADNLRTAYKELCTSYHAIDDFRAKLLGFLPLATGTGIYLLLDKLKDVNALTVGGTPAGYLLAAVGGFGFLITCGLFVYELYGIKKCCALIQAGKKMEGSLQINHGQFTTRPQNVARVINEPFAASVIYPAVLAAWTFFGLTFGFPKAKLIQISIPICIFGAGVACTLIYDSKLRTRVKDTGICDRKPPEAVHRA